MEKWEPKGLIGVVHLPALPGDPYYDGRSFDEILSFAMADADAIVEGGISSLIIENFGSAPFPKGNASQPMPVHHTAMMTIVGHEIRKKYPDLIIGINCLRNDGIAAIGIATAVKANFVRINVISGAYVTDQGIIEGDAYNVLRYCDSGGCIGQACDAAGPAERDRCHQRYAAAGACRCRDRDRKRHR